MNAERTEPGAEQSALTTTPPSTLPAVFPNTLRAPKPAMARPPKLCRHRSSGRAYVTVAGRQHYLGAWGTKETKEAYARFLLEARASGGRPSVAKPETMTVAKLCDCYEKHARGYYRKGGLPTSEVAAVMAALAPLRALYGSTQASSFGPLALKAVREALVAKGWVRKSVNGHVGRIKRAFKFAVANELVPGSLLHSLQAVDGLRAGRTEAPDLPPVRPVPEAIVEATIAHLPQALAAAVRVQMLTGMRSGEVLTMRAGDIDRTGKVWIYEPREHKTTHHGKTRVVALGPKAREAIAPLLKANPAAFVFSPREAVAEHYAILRQERKTPLWPSHMRHQIRKRTRHPKVRAGDSYTPASYRTAIRRACEQAGIECWHPHQLRHLAATKMRAQYGIEVARVLLGHATLEATELYAEADKHRAIQIAQEVG